MKTFNDLFKEYCYLGFLSESEKKLYYLIERYQDSVSIRLKIKQQQLFSSGKARFEEAMSYMVNSPSSIMKCVIKKSY